jgi:hypothetical protein
MTALLAGVFFTTSEHTQIGVATVRRERALAAAESGVADAVSFLLRPDVPVVSIGSAQTISDAREGRPVVYVTRLDSSLYSIVADMGATPSDADASTRIGVVVARSVGADGSIRVVRIRDHAWSQLF